MRNVIVTGGAGFIGSHTVVELAAAGYEPVIVDDLRNSEERILDGIASIIGRKPAFHRVDCTDEAAMDGVFERVGQVHGVIHFAAHKAVGESMERPLMYYRNNIGSLEVVLALMAKHRVAQLVFSSSCTVYGQPAELPVTERAPDNRASSPYGYTKEVCERLIRDQHAADPALKAVLLRYFNPIGAHPSGAIGELPRGVPNNLVPYVAQTAAGSRERLRINGNDYGTSDGTCVRDYIHVMDLAQGHLAALQFLQQQSGWHAINLGTGQGYSVLQMVRAFESASGQPVPYDVKPRRAGDIGTCYANPAKAKQLLGWEATRGLQEMCDSMWLWQSKGRPGRAAG